MVNLFGSHVYNEIITEGKKSGVIPKDYKEPILEERVELIEE